MSSPGSDPVRPSDTAFETTFAHGYRTWLHLYNHAKDRGINPVILAGLRMIDDAIPQYPELPADLAPSCPVQGHALAKGVLTWDAVQSGDETQSLKQDMRLQLAFPSPVVIEHTLEDGASEDDNHLAVLFAAWAYVLAARWAERLPSAAYLNHPDCEDPGFWCLENTVHDNRLAYLNSVDNPAYQWWQRIMSPGLAWEARLALDGPKEMHSPWSLHFERRRGGKRRRTSKYNTVLTKESPASFREALGFLQDYAEYHHVYDQSRAALAAALFIPVARYNRRDIRLCNMFFGEQVSSTNGTQGTETPVFAPTVALIDRMLLLSCNAFGMQALLHGAFYDPGIDCNLSGPWIQGLMRFMKDCDPVTQLSTLVLRDLDIGFLWVGAFLTTAEEACFKQISRGSWKVDLSVGAMTGTLMSFAQDTASIDNVADFVARADECRIRYAYQHSLGAPSFAFPPFGATHVGDADLEVRQYLLGGSSLFMRLCDLAWETSNPGATPVLVKPAPLRKKAGYTLQPNTDAPKPSEEERTAAEQCSKATTQAAFGWLRQPAAVGDGAGASETYMMVEGRDTTWAFGEREIFRHEWLQPLNGSY